MPKKLQKNFCVKFCKILLKIFAPYEIALIEISYVMMQKIEPKIFKICLRKYFKIFWTFLNNLNKLEIFHKFQPKNFVENYVLFNHGHYFISFCLMYMQLIIQTSGCDTNMIKVTRHDISDDISDDTTP